MTRLFTCLFLLSCVVACGSEESDTPRAKMTDTPEMDMRVAEVDLSVEMEVDMAMPKIDMAPSKIDIKEPVMVCPSKHRPVVCDGVCVSTQIDANHCGECGNYCGSTSGCNEGKCECTMAGGGTWCGAASPCAQLQSDNKHCGRCGNVCSSTRYCVEGECIDSSSGSGGVFEEVLRLTNQARATARVCEPGGALLPAVPPLTYNGLLAKAAQGHSQDMFERGFFAHDTPEGITPTARMRRAGYTGRLTGENIAYGQPTPEVVVDDWIKSPGHCVNIMRAGYKELGVGYYEGADPPRRHYWTQNFGAP